MANSKSTIYPIQLQNAELNLNKYDAEIKQYSGFNKNNAPFVGGCLSNIFTKDETIEGATKDSLYIDNNGDVYQVTDEGLFKNDVLIFEKEGEALNQKVLDLPSNIVCLYKEDVYITKEEATTEHPYGYFIFHCGEYEDVIEIKASADGEQVYFSNVYFDIEYKKVGNKEAYCVAVKMEIISGINSGALCVKTYTRDDEGDFEKWEMYTVSNKGQYYQISSLVVFPIDNTDKIGFVIFTNILVQKIGVVFDGLTPDEWDYNVVNNYTQFFRFKKNAYGYRMARLYEYASNGSSPTYITRIISRIYYDDNFPYFNLEFEDNPDVCKYINYNTSYTGSFWPAGETSISRVFTKYGAMFFYSMSYDGTRHIALGDFESGYVDYRSIGFGHVLGGLFLVNNDVVTGLTWGDKVLIAEWNSIDSDKVFFFYDRKELYYQNINNGKWYKVYTGENRLFKCDNQLVTNFNQIKNSYDLIKKRILYFAPTWNNRYIEIPYTNVLKGIVRANEEDARYFASCMNEYSLENNSSIILNPLSARGKITLYANNMQYIKNLDNRFCVNFYQETPQHTVLYIQSWDLVNQKKVKDLSMKSETLSFPTDTNGNVSYCPSLFAKFFSSFGNDVFVKEANNVYQLSKYNNQPVMSFYLGTLVEGLEDVFVLQGQYYGVINKQIFALQFYNGVVAGQTSVVSVENLQFCGNTPYEALFYSKTNRCLYSFTGANILNVKQLIDKISVVKAYKYNPATQSIFLLTDIGVIVSSLFGIYCIDMPEVENMFLLDNGVVLCDNEGHHRYIRYYKEDTDEDYLKENIKLETCFYGMNNETVTINDCLYMRLFSEEHESGDVEVSATTLSLKGRMTEKTTFKIKPSDWDKETHTIYLRYQPKEQRGLGISFKVTSPFKIASMSVGSQADAILVDKVSKGAITAPQVTSSEIKW